MDSETSPIGVLFTELQRLGAFVDYWRQRIGIEKVYLENLDRLRVPDLAGNGLLQELATKTRELLIDELKERRRGFEKLQAAFKGLTDECPTVQDPNYYYGDQWGASMQLSLFRNNSLDAEIATAKSLTERLAVEAREKEDLSVSSSAKKVTQSRSKGLSRFLDINRNEQPYDTSSSLSADSAYRQKVQKLNDEKAMIRNEIIPQNVRYVEHHRKCIGALRHVVSTFSTVHSDLAQVLNVTSSQLWIVSSSTDASMESASFAERLEDSFTSVIRPCRYRYTSYEISSPLRPTTMLFGCPLPDELHGVSIGQRAVVEAFETILSSAAKTHPQSLYDAICDAHIQTGNDIRLSALHLESLWDPSQLNGGPEAVDFLAKAPSVRLLVHFLTRLPEPFLPLHDVDVKRLAKLDVVERRTITAEPSMGRSFSSIYTYPGYIVFAKAGNRMGTARRCNLARLLFTLGRHQDRIDESRPEGAQILTRITNLPPGSRFMDHFRTTILHLDKLVAKSSGDSLILPDDFLEELKRVGLYTE